MSPYTQADWVRLFETRFSLSVEHLRQRFPKIGSLLSLLACVPSGVLASLALCLASDCLVLLVLGVGQFLAVRGS